jgi:L-fuconolactonase
MMSALTPDSIYDAQVHIWEAPTRERPWPSGRRAKPHRDVPFSAAQLLAEMDAAGVARAVLVPPSWAGDTNDVACAAARAFPDRFGVMGRFPVEERCDPGVVRSWRNQDGMLGMRLTFGDIRLRELLESGSVDWLWKLADLYGIPVMVFAPNLLDHVARIAQRFPELRLIVDHLGLGFEHGEDEVGAVVDQLLPLSDYANIAVKVSALPHFVEEEFPFSFIQAQIRRVIDAFGVERVMWGSDLSRLTCGYQEWLSIFMGDFGFISASERGWILGRSLAMWLRWT